MVYKKLNNMRSGKVKRLLLVTTVLLFAIVANAVDKGSATGKSTADKKVAVIKKPIPIANITELIKLLKKSEAEKKPIPAANITEVIRLLNKVNAEKKLIPSNEIIKLQGRLKKIECDYKQPYNAYKDGVIKDISLIFVVISCAVSIAAVVMIIFQYMNVKDAKKHIEEAIKYQDEKISEKFKYQDEKIIEFSRIIKSQDKKNEEKLESQRKELSTILKKIESENTKLSNEIEKDLNRIEKEAKENSCTAAIGFARIICKDEDNPSEKKRSIKELTKFMNAFKDNISLFNTKSRLHKRVGEYDEAIEVIDIYLSNVKYETLTIAQKKRLQVDIFLYNKACYNVLLAEQKNSETHKKTALSLLREAISLNKKLVKDADGDSDFDFIRDLNEFKEALKI
jgi:hypothetical protein